MDDLITKALNATRESKFIEFKELFDIASPQDWCEIIKDIVALANSGGGVILIGLDNRGNPRDFDVTPVLFYDPADVSNKIFKYTNCHFSEFEISEQSKGSKKVVAFRIYGVAIPIVFTKPGTYLKSDGKQQVAFSAGTVYFRHGAKSEPGDSEDLRKVIERRLQVIRKQWTKGIRKIVDAPPGAEIVIKPKAVGEFQKSTSPDALPIRVTTDPNAPAYRGIDADDSHPHRQTEALQIINSRLEGRAKVSQYDFLCLKRLYKFDNDPAFCHKPRFSSPQYSEALIDWILEQFINDNNFFQNARKECFERRSEWTSQPKPRKKLKRKKRADTNG